MRDLCLYFLDPATVANCVFASKGFFESPASPESVWRVYLKAWVPGPLCADEKCLLHLEQLAIDVNCRKLFSSRSSGAARATRDYDSCSFDCGRDATGRA